MKKLLYIALFLFSPLFGHSQEIPEPEFIGEVYIVDTTLKQYRPLPKERAQKRTVNAFNSITNRLILSEKKAPTEYPSGRTYALIIKAENNLYDPRSLFQVFKFNINFSDERYVELGSGTVGGYINQMNSNTKAFLPFVGKKYGESSYILYIDVRPGEYGVISDMHDDQYQIISTFSIYDYEARLEEQKAIEQKAIEQAMKIEEQMRKQKEREAKKEAKRNNNK